MRKYKKNIMLKCGNCPTISPIGIEPKQSVARQHARYEFECPCGYIWIDCQNTGCPMCGEEVGITAGPYDIKQPKEFPKK